MLEEDGEPLSYLSIATLGLFIRLDVLALLVPDPLRANSTPLQNPPICQPQLSINLYCDPLMQFNYHFFFLYNLVNS